MRDRGLRPRPALLIPRLGLEVADPDTGRAVTVPRVAGSVGTMPARSPRRQYRDVTLISLDAGSTW